MAVDQPGGRGGGAVGLVEHEQLGDGVGADLGEDGAHGGHLLGRVGRRGVHEVHQQVGLGRDRQRGLERLDQAVRQLGDEPDGVGEQHPFAAGQLEKRWVVRR